MQGPLARAAGRPAGQGQCSAYHKGVSSSPSTHRPCRPRPSAAGDKANSSGYYQYCGALGTRGRGGGAGKQGMGACVRESIRGVLFFHAPRPGMQCAATRSMGACT